MQTIKAFLGVLLGISLVACNSENPLAQSETASGQAKEQQVTADHEAHGRNMLALNNGAKWASDESTRIHAGNLNAFAEKFTKQNEGSVEAYHAFADDMQGELNLLVKNCRMKGAEHDALHLWLEPVITEVKELKKVSTAAEGKQVAQKLAEDVKKFNQYFN